MNIYKILKFPFRQFKKYVKHQKYSMLYSRLKKYTMLPNWAFKSNLLVADKIRYLDGCVIECGVWRGGMIAGISAVLGNNREYYLFDSFQGLPQAKDIDGKHAILWQSNKNSPKFYNNCKAEEDTAREAMELVNAKKYSIIKGWFDLTLKNFVPTTNIALLRLDCDWYDSTIVCLNHLYKYVKIGGIIIIDDYYDWDGCSKAVHDFFFGR